MTEKSSEEHVVASNRRALHDFFIVETYEAGIALKGTEVKSVRAGNVSLQDSHGEVRNGEVWLLGVHINPFEKGSFSNHDPRRQRKLLLHKSEIRRLIGSTSRKGFTLVPLKMYIKNNRVKVEIGVGRGKKAFDKRAAIAKREIERELRRKFGQ